jgi:hypothetical protein
MFSIVSRSRYPALKELHRVRIKHHPLINAILTDVQTGYVYANLAETILFVCSKAGFCLLSLTEAISPAFAEEFWHFLQENEELPTYLHLYGPPYPIQRQVMARSGQYKVRRRAQFHRRGAVPTYEYQNLMPDGYQIATIQAIGCQRLEETFPLRFSQRYWDSEQDFVTKAIGVSLINASSDPVAICYSAAIVDGLAEMDTFISPEYRGRRFMRIVSEPFFNLAMAKDLTAQWDTFVENAPSYVLAQRFHLSPVREYDLLSLIRPRTQENGLQTR